MRWLRLLTALVSAHFRDGISPGDESEVKFRVWITDVDASIMNHATMLTVMETGRIDYMVRSGFFRLAIKNRWYFPAQNNCRTTGFYDPAGWWYRGYRRLPKHG